MVKIENLNLKELSFNLDKEFHKNSKIDPRMNLDSILNNRQDKLSKTLHEKLEDFLVMYDNGLKLTIKIHEMFKEHYTEKKIGFAYLVLTGKMVTLLIGIRKMMFSGLNDCTKSLNRPLIETLDIFYACLINKELSDRFSKSDELYDNSKFYWENFSKDKLTKECTKLYETIEIDKEGIVYLNTRRKNLKAFFSESIHSSYNSAFANYMMLTLDFDIDDNYLGKITTANPKMLLGLIEEIFILNNIFKTVLEKKITEDLKDIEKQNAYALYLFFSDKFDGLYRANSVKLQENSNLYIGFINEMIEAFRNYDDA